MSKYITLSVPGTPNMNAYVSRPEGLGPFPAIMVFQEAFGVNSHIRNVTDRLAAEGFLAIAPELFHRTAPKGFEASYTDFASVQPHISVITTDALEEDIQATYNWLTMQQDVIKDKICCIGFCLGGRASFIANSFLPLKAAVSFYGGRTDTVADRAKELHAPHLFFWGGKDQHIKPENITPVLQALRDAGKDFINVEISYADHGFFCDERDAYNADAATEAWSLTRTFLSIKLGK